MGHTQQQTCLPSLSLPSKRPGSPPAKHDRALQGGSLLHRPRDLHRILPLLPYLQLLRCCFHPMRGRRGCRQPQQVLPDRVRLLPNWPCFQRCLPLHGLAPDRAPAGPTGLCLCSHSATSCTPCSTASRSPRIPSPRLSAIRSSGHAGQPSSRGAPTPSSTSCQLCLDPPLARLASPLAPWSPSRSATPCLT